MIEPASTLVRALKNTQEREIMQEKVAIYAMEALVRAALTMGRGEGLGFRDFFEEELVCHKSYSLERADSDIRWTIRLMEAWQLAVADQNPGEDRILLALAYALPVAMAAGRAYEAALEEALIA